VFVRFNPDDYLDGETNITSCWGSSNRGICQIKKSKTTEWNRRLSSLQSVIDYWINNPTEKTVEIIQLYYDIN